MKNMIEAMSLKMHTHDFNKSSNTMKARKRKYRLRSSGSTFEGMKKRILERYKLVRLINRITRGKTHRTISIQAAFEDFSVKVVLPGPSRHLWEIPRETDKLYVFCPDERIRTHRLLGKPSPGLPPPL